MRAVIGIGLGLALLASPAWSAGQRAASTYGMTGLVSDQAGQAMVTDPDLINPWGLAQLSDGAPVWTSDNGSNKSTFYDRNSGVKQTPVVAIPDGAPTGIVAVPGGITFNLKEGASQGPADFLFDTESGEIEGWAPSVDFTTAIIGFDGSGQGSVYKGLALDTANKHLIAADFTNNRVTLFDTGFMAIANFTDTTLPRRFAPFNVAVIGGKIFVAFAQRKKHGGDEIHGKGLGFVDVFDTSGNLLQHLISNGHLNAPWGMAIAPASFGTYSGKLLVGNFGDGRINAYDPSTGDFLGTLKGSNNKPLKIDGLWALDPGPGAAKVTFSAGPNDETHGLIGILTPN